MNGQECNLGCWATIYFCVFCKIEFDNQKYYKHVKYSAHLPVKGSEVLLKHHSISIFTSKGLGG